MTGLRLTRRGQRAASAVQWAAYSLSVAAFAGVTTVLIPTIEHWS